jgi:hypothetical protein
MQHETAQAAHVHAFDGFNEGWMATGQPTQQDDSITTAPDTWVAIGR